MCDKQVTCKRCKGTGLVDSHVVYAGIPGGCYNCAATGKVYVDKFYAEFHKKQGDYYGFTTTYRHGLFVDKGIARCTEEETKRVDSQTTVTKITEEQARKFFARYGVSTTIHVK